MTALAQAIEAVVSRATSDDLPPNEIVVAVLAEIEGAGHRIVPVLPTAGMLAALTRNLGGGDVEKRAMFVGAWAMGTFNDDWAAALEAAPKVA